MDDCCCGAPTSTIIERSTVIATCYTPYLGAPLPTTADQLNSILVALRAALIAKPHVFSTPPVANTIQNIAVMWPSLAVVDPDPGMPIPPNQWPGTCTTFVTSDLLWLRCNKVAVRFPTATRVCLREVGSLCGNYPRPESCAYLGLVTQAELLPPQLTITSVPLRCNGTSVGNVGLGNEFSYQGPFIPVQGCCIGNV